MVSTQRKGSWDKQGHLEFQEPSLSLPSPFSHLLRPLHLLIETQEEGRRGSEGLREAVVGMARPSGGVQPPGPQSRARGGVKGLASGQQALGTQEENIQHLPANKPILKYVPRKLHAYRQPGGSLSIYLYNTKLFYEPLFCISNPQSLGKDVTGHLCS